MKKLTEREIEIISTMDGIIIVLISILGGTLMTLYKLK